MPAGNKKKKKPAANPARGFATTSTQSKPRVEEAKEQSDVDTSAAATQTTTLGHEPSGDRTQNGTNKTERELHELTPEELEAQLETSELQQFVEKHATKVRKEASRQASRLQTDKRLLRGQVDFLSLKEWLPEELMQEVLEYALEDLNQEDQSSKKPVLPTGDSLVAKVWNLRLVLLDLDFPLERVNEAIAFLLHNPPSEDSSGQAWGLTGALDWFGLHCEAGEMLDYDAQRKKTAAQIEDGDEDVDEDDKSPSNWIVEKKQATQSKATQPPPSEEEDFEVSDLEDDLEPDQLLSVYMHTRRNLYEVNPAAEEERSKKKGGKDTNGGGKAGRPESAGERKLQQKLRTIESDVLFDQRDADAQWIPQKAELAKEALERKKWRLSKKAETKGDADTNGRDDATASPEATKPDGIANEAERLGQEMLKENEDLEDGEMLGGMFDALPGVSDQPAGIDASGGSAQAVKTRNFGRLTGIHPRRVLEETCRARDSGCKLGFKQVSPTTYSCRHSVTVNWAKEQDVLDAVYMPSIAVKIKPTSATVTMVSESAPETTQSEAYAATAALFLIFSGSPKEEKAHLRLPSAFRDLWDEFARLKRDHGDAADRQTVKEIREFIKQNSSPDEEEEEEEVVFNASSRRLNGTPSGTATPHSGARTPQSGLADASDSLKDTWSRKIATPSYQSMLLQREKLPMYRAKATAMEAIAGSQVTVVVGDTGSGKSTQLPQFLLEHELSQGHQCKIYCTEPRRISAMSLAQRVSEELGERKGDLGTIRSMVGYAIRLESHTTPQTRLVYATVGIVLRMLENSDGLKDITHLVLDEVHERSIDTDFLLIVLRSLLIKRPDLKVVLMSATVDAQKFSNYLDGAPIVSVPGRTFPVQAKFLEDAIELTGHTNEDAAVGRVEEEDDMGSDPQDKSSSSEPIVGYSKRTKATLANYDEYRIDHNLIVKLLEKVASHKDYKSFSQAILVFMPGIAEIRQLNDMLLGNPAFSQGWRIHALHSTFSSEDQQAAFEVPPHGMRKIVIATNIAETGITIPDVTCVVDTGKHREMRFDERRQMSRLIQSFIARANAKQRRGRAGRVQEGVCFHLFTKNRFDNIMVEQQTPEMLRLSLQDLVMRVKICKLGEIEHALSQALDPPSSKNIRRAVDALIEVGALTETEQLTPLGTQLAKLPLDAQLGKLLLYGAHFGTLDFALTTAAALSSKSPFLTPLHAKKQADSVRLGFKRGDSDLLTLYNAYTTWRHICTTRTIPEHHFCAKNFLSPANLAAIEDLKGQLLTGLADTGAVSLTPAEKQALSRIRPGARTRAFVALPAASTRADANDTVAQAVAAWSFYPKLLRQDGRGWRNAANNQSLGLHPTSVNRTGLPQPGPGGEARFLSFYSIMQSSSKFTNAQETSLAPDFLLAVLVGEAVCHVFAGVMVVDGLRLRFKVRGWREMVVVKVLRAKVREAVARGMRAPGREVGGRLRRWVGVLERVMERKGGLGR